MKKPVNGFPIYKLPEICTHWETKYFSIVVCWFSYTDNTSSLMFQDSGFRPYMPTFNYDQSSFVQTKKPWKHISWYTRLTCSLCKPVDALLRCHLVSIFSYSSFIFLLLYKSDLLSALPPYTHAIWSTARISCSGFSCLSGHCFRADGFRKEALSRPATLQHATIYDASSVSRLENMSRHCDRVCRLLHFLFRLLQHVHTYLKLQSNF